MSKKFFVFDLETVKLQKTLGLRSQIVILNLGEKAISLIRKKLSADIMIDMNVLDDIEANLDPKRIQQVLINLILNSVQAMSGGGVLTLKDWEGMEEDTKMLYFLVQDTGHGICKQDLDKIFVPFFTTKDVGKGLGLGLSISHSVIEKHGGRIDFESIPGEKTKFTVILPLDENSLLDPPIENSAAL